MDTTNTTSVRFLLVADIHNSGTDGLDLTGCDAAIVAGDFLKHPGRYYHAGDRDAINNTPLFQWCNAHPDFPVFLIPGNHDCVVEHSPDWIVWPKNVIRLDTVGGSVEFKGLKIFGTPWTKPHPEHDGVFVAEEKELRAKFNDIPANLDILVTHGPPMLFEGEGGLDYDRNHVSHIGSTALREAILEKKPKLVVCGHAHGGTRDEVIIGASRIINVGRVLGYRTPRFSPAFVVIGSDGTIDVTPAKPLQPSEP